MQLKYKAVWGFSVLWCSNCRLFKLLEGIFEDNWISPRMLIGRNAKDVLKLLSQKPLTMCWRKWLEPKDSGWNILIVIRVVHIGCNLNRLVWFCDFWGSEIVQSHQHQMCCLSLSCERWEEVGVGVGLCNLTYWIGIYKLWTCAEGTGFTLLTHAYITDSRLAGGSAPGPLAASQH